MKSKNLNAGFGYIDDKYLDMVEDESAIIRQKDTWVKWGVMAACVSIIAFLAYVNLSIFNPQTGGPKDVQPGKTIVYRDDKDDKDDEELKQDEKQYIKPNGIFVDASDLIASSQGTSEMVLVQKTITIAKGKYKAIYSRLNAVSTKKLDESKGENVEGLANTFHLLGHNDLQYIIQKSDDGRWELFKFQSFVSDEYPYSDVLELIYGVTSPEDIASIFIEPANMDNTDAGKKAQAEIGTSTVTEEDDIKGIYEIISAMRCYGESNWDMIDYGAGDAGMVESVRQGRYLTFNLKNGAAIDGLKYTGISGMFYEYSGIAYDRLNETDKKTVERIIGVRH